MVGGRFGGDVGMIASVGVREGVRELGWCGGAGATGLRGNMSAGSGGMGVRVRGGGLSGGVMFTY